jgi:3-oxoadipate enol-lactonase
MAEERLIEANGNRLHAVIEGDAGRPWLTCLHALAANLTLWDNLAPTLASDFRLLRLDARGHGQSTAEQRAGTLSDLAADVVAAWDALGIDRSLVLGLSLGGMTGLTLALEHPQRVAKLVAADCRADSPEFFRAMWTDRQALLAASGIEAVAEKTLPIWFSEATRRERPEIVEQARAMIVGTSVPGYLGASTALKQLDLKRRLSGIRCPTLLVCGALDGPHPAEMREMAALIPGGRYVEIADAAHMASLERPERFGEAVRAFLRG